MAWHLIYISHILLRLSQAVLAQPRHAWQLFKKIQFCSHMNFLSAQWPHEGRGCHIGHHRSRVFPLLQKVLLESIVPRVLVRTCQKSQKSVNSYDGLKEIMWLYHYVCGGVSILGEKRKLRIRILRRRVSSLLSSQAVSTACIASVVKKRQCNWKALE